MQWNKKHLTYAEQHLADCKTRIDKQKMCVADLESDGKDTRHARRLLNALIELRSLGELRLSRIREALQHDEMTLGR
jgi:hypothetical protein